MKSALSAISIATLAFIRVELVYLFRSFIYFLSHKWCIAGFWKSIFTTLAHLYLQWTYLYLVFCSFTCSAVTEILEFLPTIYYICFLSDLPVLIFLFLSLYATFLSKYIFEHFIFPPVLAWWLYILSLFF